MTKTTKAQNLALFCYQTGAMLGAGLPLLAALELGREQSPACLKTALVSLEQSLKEGSTLADAMSKHPEVFTPLIVSMVEAGELGGILEEVFAWLAEHYEREAQLLEKIKSASAYPILVLVLTTLALIFILTFVLPGFAQMLGNMGVPLPYLTQAVLRIGYFFANYGLYLGLLTIVLGYVISRALHTPDGKRWRDQMPLRLPFWNTLFIKIITARFCHILGALLNSGVPILQSLEVVKKTLGNQIISESLAWAEASLQEGKGMAAPLGRAGIFPTLLLKMIATGEETGKLPLFLLKLSGFYDKEVERSLERFTALLEPMLLLLLGGLVGGIILALLLPLFSILGSL